MCVWGGGGGPPPVKKSSLPQIYAFCNYAHINGLPGGNTPGTTGGKQGGIWYFIRVFYSKSQAHREKYQSPTYYL
jgi:hypothetical protein